MVWRLAMSLDVLRSEVRVRHPDTIVWTIGDDAHRDEDSDHNPNAEDVVCAADFVNNAGLDLARFAERLRVVNHRAIKFVIYNRRVWSKARNAEGWRPYRGVNPHTGHVHVSVGVGPEGQSFGPYDDDTPWGVFHDGGDMSAQENWEYTIVNPVTGTKMNAEDRLLDTETGVAMIRNHVVDIVSNVTVLRGEVAGLVSLVERLLSAPPVPLTPEQVAALTAAVEAAAREPVYALQAVLAGAGEALATADDERVTGDGAAG